MGGCLALYWVTCNRVPVFFDVGNTIFFPCVMSIFLIFDTTIHYQRASCPVNLKKYRPCAMPKNISHAVLEILRKTTLVLGSQCECFVQVLRLRRI